MDQRPHIVVVEDEATQRQLLCDYLEKQNFRVSAADGGSALRRLLERELPALVLLDIGLPGMSGYELARLMRAAPHGWSGRLVAMTGYGQASDLAAAEEAGFDAHLTKPADANDILDLVERLVRTGAEA